ncbi:MAG: 2-amino-4-hydroxy-6-hydroxymethyldihydropteridine diphosphokinase [Acidobacteria bacterium]|nr:2-amino-4-hydroxy-6-hydroxymethyldihydropteridine diphosphokinase [Acidobacteriota bacterium]
MKKLIYLGLGSNLGNRERHLQEAADRIGKSGVRLLRASSTYETKPMYFAGQPMFLNLVLEGETEALPRNLLRRLQQIERDLGRQRGVKNGPRTIDIDILLYGKFMIQARDLVVPHPRIEERRFVLQPLAELAPELRHPVSKQTIKDLLAQTPPEGVHRVTFRITL